MELDPAIVDIAKQYFGYVEDEKQISIIADGTEYLKECERKGMSLLRLNSAFSSTLFELALFRSIKFTAREFRNQIQYAFTRGKEIQKLFPKVFAVLNGFFEEKLEDLVFNSFFR